MLASFLNVLRFDCRFIFMKLELTLKNSNIKFTFKILFKKSGCSNSIFPISVDYLLHKKYILLTNKCSTLKILFKKSGCSNWIYLISVAYLLHKKYILLSNTCSCTGFIPLYELIKMDLEWNFVENNLSEV